MATVASAVAHGVTTAEPDVGLIGASGGISGVVTFYALQFPRIRLGQFFWWLRLFRRSFWFTFSARTGLVLWFAFQVIGLLLGHNTVSYAGHLGGALAGVACWLLVRATEPERDRASAGTRSGVALRR